MGEGLKRAFAATKATRVKDVWCVQHRGGWCAVADKKCPDEDASSVETKCGHFVILPWSSTKRIPTCVECIEKL